MLEVRDLRKTYAGVPQPVEAVAEVSFDVSPGEFLSVCGRSGSGKSTLLAMLAGLTEPSSGRVLLDGADIFSMPRAERTRLRTSRIGVAFQFAGLLPTLRAIDNVAFPGLVAGSKDDPVSRAGELLRQVGLADRLDAYPHELSGGEQRRVALARALIQSPTLLLCDEPTSDLDPTTAAEVLALLLELHHHHGTTLVVVTHDENLARHGDRILYLDHGRIESVATPSPPLSLPTRGASVSVTTPEALRPATGRLGAGFGELLARFALAMALGILAVSAADRAAGLYRRHQQDERLRARRALEGAAMQQLRADVDRLTLEPGDSYSLGIYLQNIEPEAPLFVTAPAVRAFVQVERDWIEVPARESEGATEGVVSLSGKRVFRFTVKPDVARYTELITGYMHVRFSNALVVSRDRSGVTGLFERKDDYYVYLKPHAADDAAICEKNHWTNAPLWIAMPPH
jgi:putative ABC transport system ATP-binding protein/macrolide transport system ATP-binding/permease protein/lipoprotein-releasing system ATP-binding protein